MSRIDKYVDSAFFVFIIVEILSKMNNEKCVFALTGTKNEMRFFVIKTHKY